MLFIVYVTLRKIVTSFITMKEKNIKLLFYLSGTLLYMSTSGAMLTLIIIQELLQKTNEVSIYKNKSVFWLGIILDRLLKNCIK